MEISDPEPKYGLSRSGPVVRGVDLHLCLGRSTTGPLLKERLMPIQEQPFKNPTLEALGDHLKLHCITGLEDLKIHYKMEARRSKIN